MFLTPKVYCNSAQGINPLTEPFHLQVRAKNYPQLLSSTAMHDNHLSNMAKIEKGKA
jgi:hypothetical protein